VTVTIVALTANAFIEDLDRALDAGMNANVAKPVKQDKIIDVVFRHINRT
jgi:CheY-like chemotaxis protein